MIIINLSRNKKTMVSTRHDKREFIKNENSSLHFDGLRTPLCVLNARLSNVDPEA